MAPEHGRDDYAGLDVKGKIVVALSGAPKFLQSEERAYYRSGRVKLKAALDHGAVGYVSIGTLTGERLYPFANVVRQYKSWGMTWRKPDGKPFVAVTLPQLAGISVAGAPKFLGADTGKILAAAETKDGAIKGFALPLILKVESHSEVKNFESENIVGLLPGSDPKLKNEYVVLSGHLDHIGITPPVKGDSINNGALDNASGVATTLEVARLMQAGKKPRRSALFLVDTGEEKGLLGAEYFARNPTVPLSAITADVDLDMPLLTYDFTDVTAFGADRSSIGPAVRSRRRKHDRQAVALIRCRTRASSTRSDHYRASWNRACPPCSWPPAMPMAGEAATSNSSMRTNYHKPSDADLSPAYPL